MALLSANDNIKMSAAVRRQGSYHIGVNPRDTGFVKRGMKVTECKCTD
jgi:hypothetical protein